MKKNLFISLVSFMIVSILGIIILQGYWIFSAWNDKEKEFSLAVQQSLIRVADQIQERDAKEIEIEKRLKESSELLKKAKQPQPDKKELVSKKGKSKRKVIILTFSILLLVCFFTYNLINLFLEDLLIRFPLVQKAYDQLDYYISIITGMFLILIESIMNSISNLG